MIVGINDENEKYFASSDTPLIGHCNEVNYFEDGDFGFVNTKEIVIFDKNNIKKEPQFSTRTSIFNTFTK